MTVKLSDVVSMVWHLFVFTITGWNSRWRDTPANTAFKFKPQHLNAMLGQLQSLQTHTKVKWFKNVKLKLLKIINNIQEDRHFMPLHCVQENKTCSGGEFLWNRKQHRCKSLWTYRERSTENQNVIMIFWKSCFGDIWTITYLSCYWQSQAPLGLMTWPNPGVRVHHVYALLMTGSIYIQTCKQIPKHLT